MFVIFVLGWFLNVSGVIAQEAEDSYGEEAVEETVEDVDSGPPVEVQLPPRLEKKATPGSRNREKNVQGTKAIRRFETETVIKSPYKLKGVQLDVDPD